MENEMGEVGGCHGRVGAELREASISSVPRSTAVSRNSAKESREDGEEV